MPAQLLIVAGLLCAKFRTPAARRTKGRADTSGAEGHGYGGACRSRESQFDAVSKHIKLIGVAVYEIPL